MLSLSNTFCKTLSSNIILFDLEVTFCMTRLAPYLSIQSRTLLTLSCLTSTPTPRPRTIATAFNSLGVLCSFRSSAFHSPAPRATQVCLALRQVLHFPLHPNSASSACTAHWGSCSTNTLHLFHSRATPANPSGPCLHSFHVVKPFLPPARRDSSLPTNHSERRGPSECGIAIVGRD